MFTEPCTEGVARHLPPLTLNSAFRISNITHRNSHINLPYFRIPSFTLIRIIAKLRVYTKSVRYKLVPGGSKELHLASRNQRTLHHRPAR